MFIFTNEAGSLAPIAVESPQLSPSFDEAFASEDLERKAGPKILSRSNVSLQKNKKYLY